MMFALSLAIALIAGAMSIALFYIGLRMEHAEKSDRKSVRNIFIWAVLFLGASFGNIEWSFWLLGYNMFTFFAFPLVAFFAIWFGWVVWLFERRGERKVWLAFLAALLVLTAVAVNCMNCVSSLA